MKSFNGEETIAILVCKQMSFNSFENKITDKLFTYKSWIYIHLNCVQTNDWF